MRTNEEYEAYRDKLAAEMPSFADYKFPTFKDIFDFIGETPSSKYADQLEAGLKAEVKLRYMYADAMLEARKQ